jgi:hypothetical protein
MTAKQPSKYMKRLILETLICMILGAAIGTGLFYLLCS